MKEIIENNVWIAWLLAALLYSVLGESDYQEALEVQSSRHYQDITNAGAANG